MRDPDNTIVDRNRFEILAREPAPSVLQITIRVVRGRPGFAGMVVSGGASPLPRHRFKGERIKVDELVSFRYSPTRFGVPEVQASLPSDIWWLLFSM